MRDLDYKRAEEEERLHFIQCAVCGNWIDCRDFAEMIAHREDEMPEPVGAKPEPSKRP